MNNIPANKETCEVSLNILKRMQPWGVKNSPYVYNHIVPASTLSPWYSDIEFIEIYSKIGINYTLVDHYRCYELWTLAKQTHKIPGVILEVGVWRGGSGALLAKAAPDKKVYLADTFSGVVKASSKDLTYIGGEHSDTSRATVQTILDELDITNADVLVGVFPDDTGHMISENIALLHCDVDVYESARDITQWCLPKLSVGGILVFDDYGFEQCNGISLLCDMLREDENLLFLYNLNGHAIFIKIK